MFVTILPKKAKREGLITIEMHERDLKVRDWILAAVAKNGGEIKISHEAIATQFQCTRVTARNIVTRLISAGYLHAKKKSNRDGYYYYERQ